MWLYALLLTLTSTLRSHSPTSSRWCNARKKFNYVNKLEVCVKIVISVHCTIFSVHKLMTIAEVHHSMQITSKASDKKRCAKIRVQLLILQHEHCTWLQFHSSDMKCELPNAKPFFITRGNSINLRFLHWNLTIVLLKYNISISYFHGNAQCLSKGSAFAFHILWNARCEQMQWGWRKKERTKVSSINLNLISKLYLVLDSMLFCSYIMANLAHFMAHIQATKSPQCGEWANEFLRLDLDTPTIFD